MRITAEISLYPLADDFVGDIREFIRQLRREPGLEIISNQLSTQLRGEYAAVTGAIGRCMAESMRQGGPMVFVVKYISADLPIGTPPRLEAV
ncbi:MAG: YkoF family thiamine/hydroxymethylpyrimidine-binding protein [Gammaproteobacteria bacterium]|nr:MAG: YkoF family thiamine/hydroxymethylpyrimidine-binding protein [Gammaproteobacteria bacterium]